MRHNESVCATLWAQLELIINRLQASDQSDTSPIILTVTETAAEPDCDHSACVSQKVSLENPVTVILSSHRVSYNLILIPLPFPLTEQKLRMQFLICQVVLNHGLLLSGVTGPPKVILAVA